MLMDTAGSAYSAAKADFARRHPLSLPLDAAVVADRALVIRSMRAQAEVRRTLRHPSGPWGGDLTPSPAIPTVMAAVGLQAQAFGAI